MAAWENVVVRDVMWLFGATCGEWLTEIGEWLGLKWRVE